MLWHAACGNNIYRDPPARLSPRPPHRPAGPGRGAQRPLRVRLRLSPSHCAAPAADWVPHPAGGGPREFRRHRHVTSHSWIIETRSGDEAITAYTALT